MKFSLGKVVQTRGIANECEQNESFYKEINNAINLFINCDWGELCKEDKEMNDSAIKNNDDRIVARYKTSIEDIYIITEYDRSATTILFVSEY